MRNRLEADRPDTTPRICCRNNPARTGPIRLPGLPLFCRRQRIIGKGRTMAIELLATNIEVGLVTTNLDAMVG